MSSCLFSEVRVKSPVNRPQNYLLDGVSHLISDYELSMHLTFRLPRSLSPAA